MTWKNMIRKEISDKDMKEMLEEDYDEDWDKPRGSDNTVIRDRDDTFSPAARQRKLYIRSRLAEEAKMFLKDVEEHLDGIMPSIKQEFDRYPDYDRKQIEKLILFTLKEDIDNIKRSLKSEQVILEGLEMKKGD